MNFNESYCEHVGSIMDKLLPKRRGTLTDENLEKEVRLAINSPKYYSAEGIRMIDSMVDFPKVFRKNENFKDPPFFGGLG